MDEWQKTLVGTLSGFLAGVLLEPIRFRTAAVLRRSSLKADLYNQLGRIRFALARYKELANELTGPPRHPDPLHDPLLMLQEVSADFFEYVFTNEKVALYGMPEYEAFKELYQTAAKIREEAGDSGAPDHDLNSIIDKFNSEIERLMSEGILSPRRLNQATRAHRRRLAARINKYFRR
jgi:hypothetical protein